LVPGAFASVAAAPAAAVAVKVTGDPLAPLSVAMAVCAPDAVPSVHTVLAIPFTSVAAEVGSTEALGAVVDQATVAPAGAPSSVTTTRSGVASDCPTVPV
jgi:hypothetical protein